MVAEEMWLPPLKSAQSRNDMRVVIRLLHAKIRSPTQFFEIVERGSWAKDEWRRQGGQVLTMRRALAVPNLPWHSDRHKKIAGKAKLATASALLMIATFLTAFVLTIIISPRVYLINGGCANSVERATSDGEVLGSIPAVAARCQYNVTGGDRSHGLPALSRVW